MSELWEVFVRSRRGLSHQHVGSLHAPDAGWRCATRATSTPAARRACRSGSCPRATVTASSPDEKDAFFDPAADKPYRHPTFYEVPDEVKHL